MSPKGIPIICGPRPAPAYPFQPSQNRQAAGVSDQQYQLAATDHCRVAQKSLAGGIVLQMEQARLRLKKFLGTSQHAVKTQIWCAVSTYVLIAIVKKELQLKASLYTLLQILSVSVFENILISCALQPDATQIISPPTDSQLLLFNF